MSAAIVSTRPGVESRFAAASSFFGERPTMTSSAPFRSAAAATPRPMPELPPTTTTLLPTSDAIEFLVYSLRSTAVRPLEIGDDDLLHLLHGGKHTPCPLPVRIGFHLRQG